MKSCLGWQNGVLRIAAIPLFLAGQASAQNSSPNPDPTNMSLEELMNIKVVSASRTQKKLSQTSAAIYVITREDIAHSGASSIPELLRRVPGLHVAQITAGQWGISARGLTQQYSDKLLVMIDGRSIYTNLFSGVYWDQNSLPLDEIERIEVIRGPGATMWGANAVNGVINIITRNAADTQGGLATLSAGTYDRANTEVRYGGEMGPSVKYRAYGNYFNRNQMLDANLQPAGDGYQTEQVGARADWKPTPRDTVLLESEADRSQGHALFEANVLDPNTKLNRLSVTAADASFLGRWRRELDDKQSLEVQFSSTSQHRDELGGFGVLNIIDAGVQHQVSLGSRNNLLYGVSFRNTWDTLVGGNEPGASQFIRPHRIDRLFSTFVQNDFSILPESLVFSLGTKIEHNDFTGFEFEPNARLIWTPGSHTSLWAAVSRAVSTPNVVENDVIYQEELPPPAPPGYLAVVTGNPNIRSEVLVAYEAGYRRQFGERFSLDIAAFRNRYFRLHDLDTGEPVPTAAGLIFPITYGNNGSADTHGVEAAATWQVTRRWRMDGSYSWLHVQDLGYPPVTNSDTAPQHQVKLHSEWEFHRNFLADVEGYWLSSIHAFAIRPNTRINTNVIWHASPRVDLGLAISNLTDTHSVQLIAQDTIQEMLDRRTVEVRLAWKF